MADISTANLDSGTDSPAAARVQLLEAVIRINELSRETVSALHFMTADEVTAVMTGVWTIVPDVTTALQAAMSHAVSVNGKLTSPAKANYLIAGSLTIPSGLIADFNHSTIKRKVGSVFNLLSNTGGTGIYIENLIVDGNRQADGRVATNVGDRFGGIVLNSVTFSELHNVQVNNTVNSEDGRAGVYLGSCTNVDLYNVGGTGNDRSCIFIDGGSFNRTFTSYTKDNLGSGVTSFGANDCEYYACTAINSGYSGISINGLRCKANGLRSTGTAAGYGGINIGHNSTGNTADDAIIENVHSYSNSGWGVVVAGSARVQLRGVYSALNVNPNVYIFDASTACKIDGLVSSGSTAGSGVLITAGTGHSIANAEIFGNFAHGVDAETGTQVVLDMTVRCYNNGQGAAGLAGVLLNGSVGSSCYAECFDNQGTKTQGYGVWLSGGSGNIIGGYLHDNLTAPIRESGSPVYSTTKVRVGTNVMAGSFVPAAGVTTVTINNNNARAGMNVIFFAVNTAGTTLGIPRLGVITPGTSFVANLVATAAGTEGYGYVIL